MVTQAGLPSRLRDSACLGAPRLGSEPATPNFEGWGANAIQVDDFRQLFEMLRPFGFPRSGEASEGLPAIARRALWSRGERSREELPGGTSVLPAARLSRKRSKTEFLHGELRAPSDGEATHLRRVNPVAIFVVSF